MKKTDIAMIIFIASVSMLIAYFVGSSIFSGMTTEGERVKTIEAITSTVDSPSEDVFNKDAINPTIEVQITGSPTTDPADPTNTDTTDPTTPTDTQNGTQ